MSRDSLVFAASGMLFGLLVGWMLGSLQSGSRTPAARAAAPAAAAPSAPPLDVRRVAELERIANAEPANAAVRVELGNLYYDAERFDLAIPWYEAALKLQPSDVDVSTDLGVCFYYTNQVDRALAQFDRSLAIDSAHVKTLLNQGIVRAFGKEDLEGAARSWERVVALAPGTEEARRAQQALEGLRSAHPDLGRGGAAGTGRGGGGRGSGS